MFRTSLYILGAYLILSRLTVSAPVLGSGGLEDITPREEQTKCSTIQGNADFYGIGIRIGIYLQWITTLLTYHFLHDAIRTNLETSTIFLVAIYIATAVATAGSTVQSAELLVLLQLCFGSVFSILTIWGSRISNRPGLKPINFPLIGSFFRLTLATALSAYGVWFWFAGKEALRDQDQCPDYTFLFAKVSTEAGGRIFFQIQSVLILVGYGILFARELLLMICFFCIIGLWTAILAVVMVTFRLHGAWKSIAGAGDAELAKRSWLYELFKWTYTLLWQWVRLSFAVSWKQVNGNESTGDNRPYLEFYLIMLTDFCILFLRTTFQFVCLLIFKRCPPIGFPPTILEDSGIYDTCNRPRALWHVIICRIKKLYKSIWFTRILYTINIISIIWSIVSVELTLIWNKIEGVYILNSTGQLIPFVIGVVGLLRVLHGISVEQSKAFSTNILMSVFDLEPPETRLDGPGEVGVGESNFPFGNQDDAKYVFPLSNGDEAIFWERRMRRRHSFSVITPCLIDIDVCDSTPVEEEQYHLKHRGEYSSLRNLYGRKGVQVYPLTDGRYVYIVKDYRNEVRGRSRRRPINSKSDTRKSRSAMGCSEVDDSISLSSIDSETAIYSVRDRGSPQRKPRSSSEVFRDRPSKHYRSHSRSRSRSRSRTYTGSDIPQENTLLKTLLVTIRLLVPPYATKFWRMVSWLVKPLFEFAYHMVKKFFSRIRFAARELRKRLRKRLHDTGERLNIIPPSPGSEHDSTDNNNDGPIISAPHIRRKGWRARLIERWVSVAVASRSLPQILEALVAAVGQISTDLEMPETAENMEHIRELFCYAREVRQRRRAKEINEMQQHEEMDAAWTATLLDVDVGPVFLRELRSRPKPRVREGWTRNRGLAKGVRGDFMKRPTWVVDRYSRSGNMV